MAVSVAARPVSEAARKRSAVSAATVPVVAMGLRRPAVDPARVVHQQVVATEVPLADREVATRQLVEDAAVAAKRHPAGHAMAHDRVPVAVHPKAVLVHTTHAATNHALEECSNEAIRIADPQAIVAHSVQNTQIMIAIMAASRIHASHNVVPPRRVATSAAHSDAEDLADHHG